MAALLSSRDKQEDIIDDISECRRLGIDILPPDVNNSASGFTVEQLPSGAKAIRYGILSIAGVGEKAVTAILEHRPYSDIADFFNKVNKRVLNKKVVDALIKCGCFDFAEANRFETLNQYHFKLRGDKPSSELPILDPNKYDLKQRLAFEKEWLGLYVSGHPLSGLPFRRWSEVGHRQEIDLAGRITSIRSHKDSKGRAMAFIKIETQEDTRDVVVFAKTYEESKGHLSKDNIIVVRGKKDEGKNSLLADKIFLPRKKTPKTEEETTTPISAVTVKPDPLLELFR